MSIRRVPFGVRVFWIAILLLIVGFTIWLVVLPDVVEGAKVSLIRLPA